MIQAAAVPPATNELQLQQLCDEDPSFSELQ
jgi:hypothetical protein